MMEIQVRTITTAQEAEAIREIIEAFASDGWDYDPETRRFDWEDWFNRLERYHPDLDFGNSWDTPAIRKVKRIAREAIEEAGLI
jgi:hypothetical protein